MIKQNSSQNLAAHSRPRRFSALILLAGLLALRLTQVAALATTNTPSAIPWNEIGAKAGANYQGDGLAVTPTESGARLHCVFQRLDGEATPEGLWLTSTVTNTVSDRFRVTAMAVGRVADGPLTPALSPFDGERVADRPGEGQLPCTGSVSVCGRTVRFSRPGLQEEYSVSMDGVRQDFIVEQAPPSPPDGELVVRLAVAGTEVESAVDGARLVLDHSGRKIAYSRLRVTDATGKELPARIEVEANSALFSPHSSLGLAVVVDDAEAVYPVRIDPTLSDANWVSMGAFPGANGTVHAAVTDGSGNLYIGGIFTAVGNTVANNVAQWNGSSWSALGSGMNDEVLVLAVSGSTLYAGGDFTTAGSDTNANYIAQWNGSSWSSLGSGMMGADNRTPYVFALAVSGGTLYAGGGFSTAGGSAANSIAQWNGSSWSALGSGINGGVYSLAVSGGTLYAGGSFTNAGVVAANYVAQWNGSSWSPLGSGLGGYNPYFTAVFALAVSDSTLYAGGDFTTAGGSPANYIAQWNGSSWSPVGSGMNDDVLALAVSGSTVYAGGLFSTAGGTAANAIAQWNGTSWSALGSGMNNYLWALALSGSTVYAGGLFTTAGGSLANNIAQWNGSTWSVLGSGIIGLNSYVEALAVSGSTVFAGGDFTTAGNTNANYIAQWNGTSWSPLGSGMNSDVYALAVWGGTLYAGGNFTTAGGSAANYIAQWNGTNWSPLGSGMNEYGYVEALAVSGGTLYAGGDFTTAGGNAANYIAQWNGTNWSALGSGIGGSVSALAVSGGTLYAGGDFTTAGGTAANDIAEWNGSIWSALGSGISGMNSYGEGPDVQALAVSGSTLYAGGQFTTAGSDTNANCIAQWNGSSWSALGSGISGGDEYIPFVSALAVSGSTLYVGGLFTVAGGSAANCIAQWNRSNWSALGSGMNYYVSALAVAGGTLYAGGDFTTAGTNVSAYAALAYLPGSLAIITTNVAFGFTGGVFGFDVSGPSGASVVIQASTDLHTWIPLQTNILGSGPLYFSDPQSTTNLQRFYRAKLSP